MNTQKHKLLVEVKILDCQEIERKRKKMKKLIKMMNTPPLS